MMNPSPITQEYMERGRSDTCPIIDMHGHVGTFYGAYLPSATPERMLSRMERCGVRTIVCSHHMAMAYDEERGNALMQKTIDTYPEHFLGFWVVNPNHPEIMEGDLSRLERTRGFVGFKLWPDYHLVPVTSPKYEMALRYANDHGLLVLVHTFGHSPYDRPALVAEVAQRYPNARFQLGHSGYGEWEVAATAARDLPNVYLDLASVVIGIDFNLMPGGSLMPGVSLGSPQVNGLIEYMVETATSEKFMFGSDLPWYSQHYHAGAVLFARISDEDRHNILHRNAERLLGPWLAERHAAIGGST